MVSILNRYLLRGSRRGPPHFILKIEAAGFLQKLGYSVDEEVSIGHLRVDVLGVLGSDIAVVECGKAPIWRIEELYGNRGISRLYWWKYNKPRPFTLRLCALCSDTLDLLNGGYPECCDLPRRKYLINRNREYCHLELIRSLDSVLLKVNKHYD